MADDLSLQLVIKALLDSKGFEDAKAALGQLATKANESAPALDKTGGAAKGLSKEMGGARGGVADLTRALLQNIGITGPAGEVAKATGTAVNFFTGAATAAAVAATGFTAAAVLLLPTLLDLAGANDDVAANARAAADSLLDFREQVNRYLAVAPDAPQAVRDLAAALDQLALARQRQEIQSVKDKIAELEAGMRRVPGPIESMRFAFVAAFGDLTAWQEKHNQGNKDNAQTVETLRIKLGELEEAQRRGVVLGEDYARKTREAEEASRLRTEALDRERKAQEDLNAAIRDGERFQKTFVDQGALARDSERLAKAEKERAEAVGELTEAQVEQFTVFETEEKRRARRQREVEDAEAALAAADKQRAAEKRADDAATVAQGFAITAQLFGQSKAARIAQAVADTYAAATRALADFPWPYNLAIAALMIAQGRKNVMQIQKANLGFDDPFSDLLAERLGRRSAGDFVKHFGVGFEGGMRGAGGAIYNQTSQTTINQGGPNVTVRHLVGGDRAAVERWLMRTLSRAQRRDARARLR
jgi:hypothetical protein